MNSRPFGSMNNLWSSILSTAGTRCVLILVGIATTALRARGLGSSGFGVLAVSICLPTIMAAFLQMGVSVANTYFVNRCQVGARQAWLTGVLWSVCVSVGAIVLMPLLYLLFASFLFRDLNKIHLVFVLACLPLMLLRSISNGILQAVHRFKEFNVSVLVENTLTFVLTAIVFSFFGCTVENALIACLVSLFLVVVLLFLVLNKLTTELAVCPWQKRYILKCLKFGSIANLANVFAIINYRADLLLVNLFTGAQLAGLYAGIMAISEKVWLISQATSTVAYPKLAASDLNDVRTMRLTERMCVFVFWITAFAATLLSVFSDSIIKMVLGPDFLLADGVLLALLPGVIIASFSRVLANLFAAQGWVPFTTKMAGLLVVVNLIGNSILLPWYGIIGAALASTIGWMVYGLLVSTVYVRETGRPWYYLFLPAQHDINTALNHFSLKNFQCEDSQNRFILKNLFHGTIRKTVVWSLMLGMLITAFTESHQSALIRPIRNLIVLGKISERKQDLFSPTRYKHGVGVNPVHIAQSVRDDALAILQDVEDTHELVGETQRLELLKVATYFTECGHVKFLDGKVARLWPYEFDYPYYGIISPWYSGMAQGHAIEVLIAAYYLTDEQKYLVTAEQGARGLGLSIDDGGVAVKEGPGIWFEEYASCRSRPPFVLNGHNFALNGLWHLSVLRPTFRSIYEQGIIALKAQLPKFDRKIWSSYDLAGTPANRKYHRIHCDQLKEIFLRTKDDAVGFYANKFYLELFNPLHILYRLLVFPSRMLIVLILGNSASIFLLSLCCQHYFQRRGVKPDVQNENDPCLRSVA